MCISTYEGSILCLDRNNGQRLWVTYVRRDTFRYESFYASPSTDGERIYCASRSGRVVALDATNGDVLWTHQLGGWGYTTPAIAGDRVFVGNFDGNDPCIPLDDGCRALEHVRSAARPSEPRSSPASYVFFSTLDKRTFALRTTDGKIVWRFPWDATRRGS